LVSSSRDKKKTTQFVCVCGYEQQISTHKEEEEEEKPQTKQNKQTTMRITVLFFKYLSETHQNNSEQRCFS